MPDNTNADALRARTRAFATIDALAEVYLTCQQFTQYWTANNTDAAVPATGDIITDPSNPDPDRPMTNNALRQINSFAVAFVADFDANNKQKANAVLSRNSNGKSRI